MKRQFFAIVGNRQGVTLTCAMGLELLMMPAAASGQLDQRNDAFLPNLLNSVQLLSAVGQEFLPAQSSLKVVTLRTEDFDDAEHAGAQLYVNIRDDTIDGAILGASSLVSLPDGFKGVTHFEFPAEILISPSRRYVIEVVAVSGDNWAVGRIDQFPDDTYPAGAPITLDEPEPEGTADAWFREGISDPFVHTTDPLVDTVIPALSQWGLLILTLLLLAGAKVYFGRRAAESLRG